MKPKPARRFLAQGLLLLLTPCLTGCPEEAPKPRSSTSTPAPASDPESPLTTGLGPTLEEARAEALELGKATEAEVLGEQVLSVTWLPSTRYDALFPEGSPHGYERIVAVEYQLFDRRPGKEPWEGISFTTFGDVDDIGLTVLDGKSEDSFGVNEVAYIDEAGELTATAVKPAVPREVTWVLLFDIEPGTRIRVDGSLGESLGEFVIEPPRWP